MKPTSHHDYQAGLQKQIDRLVDGEMQQEELQHFLDSLEQTPESWKQVALTFLESQALRRLVQADRRAFAGVSLPEPQGTPSAPHSPWRSPQPTKFGWNWGWQSVVGLLGMAIGFGMAHLLTRDEGTMANLRPLDHSAVAESSAPAPYAPAPFDAPLLANPMPATELQKWWQEASSMPEEVRATLQSSGQRVRRNMRLIPVTTRNGGWGIVPVEQLQIDPPEVIYQ